jgi:hypothetical protein
MKVCDQNLCMQENCISSINIRTPFHFFLGFPYKALQVERCLEPAVEVVFRHPLGKLERFEELFGIVFFLA